MIKFHESLQTMMAALDDEIKHLQQEIEGAEEQVQRLNWRSSLLTNHQRRQLQAAVDNQQEAAQ